MALLEGVMMGLLDPTDDPRTMGLLSLGMGLLGSKGSFGNALSQAGPQALQAMRQVQQDKARKEQMAQAQQMQQLQMQQAQLQIAEQQRAAAEAEAQRGRDEQFRSAIPAPVGAPIAQGATPFGGFNIPGAVDPKQALLHQALLQKQLTPMQYLQMTQKDNAPIKIGKDERLLEQGTNRVLVDALPDGPAKLPSAVQEYEYAKGQGYRGTFQQFQLEQRRAGASNTTVSYGAPVAGVDAQGRPVFFQPDKGGGAPSIVQGVAPPKNDKPMTEAQAKAATFKSQMESAEKELGKLPLDMSKLWNQADVGMAAGWTNAAASPTAQRARQAQEQWSESFLRFKTGAAATADEVRMNVRTFFPQPGDSKPVIEQKQRMRQQAIQDIGVAASGNLPDHSAGQPKAVSDPLGLRGGK